MYSLKYEASIPVPVQNGEISVQASVSLTAVPPDLPNLLNSGSIIFRLATSHRSSRSSAHVVPDISISHFSDSGIQFSSLTRYDRIIFLDASQLSSRLLIKDLQLICNEYEIHPLIQEKLLAAIYSIIATAESRFRDLSTFVIQDMARSQCT